MHDENRATEWFARARHGLGSGVGFGSWTSVLAAIQRHRCYRIYIVRARLVVLSCVTLFGVLHYFVTGRASFRRPVGARTSDEIRRNKWSAGACMRARV